MPLAMIREGSKTVLRSIQGGRGLRGRLAALGLIPGTEITVLRNGGGGPFVVAVNNSPTIRADLTLLPVRWYLALRPPEVM